MAAAREREENRRSRQLKNVREGIRTLKDRLGVHVGGVYDGKDPDKALWFIAMVEEVLDLYNLRKNQFIVRAIIVDYIHVRDWIPTMIFCSLGAQ